MKSNLSGKLVLTSIAFAVGLFSAAGASAMGGHAEQYPTSTTVAVGHYTTGEGQAPIVEGKIGSTKAICRKGRSVSASFVPGDGSSSITLQGAISKTDGSWSSRLPAADEGLAGEIEVRISAKTASSSVACRQTNFKQELTL